ncbi:hypothetical protein BDQ12DRAFT_657550, partial [Crucibulum laeve]
MSENNSQYTSDAYCTPPPHLAYSLSFFSLLTFKLVADMTYPIIAPENSVLSFDFDYEVPGDATGTVIMPYEVVPHINDVMPISRRLAAEFSRGKRSVKLVMSHSGRLSVSTVHFYKITLFKLINNYEIAVKYASRLVKHLAMLHIHDKIVGRLLDSPITMAIRGFYITQFPLWKLGYLLDETWVEEDILNAMAELVYFKAAAGEIQLKTAPSFLFLPT